MSLDLPLLDPKIDVVFKMLFADPDSEPMLIGILNAVLKPKSLIVSATVTNPELPKVFRDDKGTILDIHAVLADGALVNVEMQCSNKGDVRRRALYHWGRTYTAQLRRGKSHVYAKLMPTNTVFFLNYIEFRGALSRLQHTFYAQDQCDSGSQLEGFRVDFVQLPQLVKELGLAREQGEIDPLAFWSTFLLNPSDSCLEEMGMKEPAIRKAKEKLEKISRDDAKRELARMREKADLDWRSSHYDAREQGLAEGRVEGQQFLLTRLLQDPTFRALGAEKITEMTQIPLSEVEEILKNLGG